MTWEGFYKWLEQNRIRYSPGDYHFEGRGFWFPEPPDLTTGAVAPRPAPPWINVFKSSVDTGKRTIETVDVTTSFSPPQYGIESPKEAQAAVVQALMDFDLALGAEPFNPPPMREPETRASRGGRPISDEAYERGSRRVEAEWRERNKALLERSRPYISTGPEVSPRYRSEQDIAEEKRDHWLASAMKKKFEGLTPDDSDVSDSCDLGAHERCPSCGCGCHSEIRTTFPKQCGCGRIFTRAQWNKLKLKGHQVTEADEFGPEELIELKDCPSCFSTLGV